MIHKILRIEGDKPFLLVDWDEKEIGRYSTKANAMKKILSLRVKEPVKEAIKKVKKVIKNNK